MSPRQAADVRLDPLDSAARPVKWTHPLTEHEDIEPCHNRPDREKRFGRTGYSPALRRRLIELGRDTVTATRLLSVLQSI